MSAARQGLRWAIYSRISGKQGAKTGDSDDETASLETQEELNRKLVATLDPTGTVVESLVLREIHTGVELFTRPKLMRTLLAAIRRGEIDAVACYHPWRWTRDPNHAGYLYSELDHHRVLLRFTVDDPGDDEKGRLLGYVQHWSGQHDHKTRTEQTHRGRSKLVHLGQAWAGAKPPYGFGWRYETTRLPDGQIKQKKIGWREEPAEAMVLTDVFKRFVAGASLRGLALDLTKTGVPSPTGRPHWTDKTIRYLLSQSVYIGEGYGLRHQRDKENPRVGQRGKSAGQPRYRDTVRPEADWVKLPDGYAPRLVSDEVFAAAQALLARAQRGGSPPSVTAQQTLMGGGRSRCGECGNTLSRLGANRLALICSGRAMKKCRSRPSIRMALLDDAARRLAAWIYQHPEALAEQARAHRETDPTEDDLAMVDARLAELTRQQRGVALVAAAVEDVDAAAPLAARLQEIAEQKRQAETDRAGLLERRAGWAETDHFLAGFSALAGRVAPRLARFTHEDWQKAIDALGIRARVYPAAAAQRYELQTRVGDVSAADLRRALDLEAGADGEAWGEDAVWLMRSGAATSSHEPQLTLIWSAHQVAALPSPPTRLAPAPAASPTSPTTVAV